MVPTPVPVTLLDSRCEVGINEAHGHTAIEEGDAHSSLVT